MGQFVLKSYGLLDWLMPQALIRKATVDHIRARIFVAIVVCPLLCSGLYYGLYGHALYSEQSAWFFPVHLTIAVASLIFIRWTGHFRTGVFIYLTAIHLLICFSIIKSGSIHSIYYSWIPVRIIGAVLLLEAGSALWLCLLYIVLTLACLEINSIYGLQLPGKETLTSFTQANLFSLVAAEFVVIVIALFFENFRRRKRNALLHERSKIAQSLGVYALGEMVGGVSHEVNNPLAIAMGLLIQYEKIADQPGTRSDLLDMQQKFDRSLQRIRYVVEGLKTFSQGELDEAIEKLSIQSIFTQLMTLNQDRLSEQNMRLRFTDRTGNLTFGCRPHQLIRTLQGLITNALEATVDQLNGRIELKIFQAHTQLHLQVIDNGRGIPLELRHRIFEPFFSTKSFQTGQGLTLAISKGIIESQGGQMSYQPLPLGSCFMISLPLDLNTSTGDSYEKAAIVVPPTTWQKISGVFGNRARSFYLSR